MIPLFGEGHQEAFFAFFVLQSHHCLLDVVVVGLELLLEVGGLVIEACKGKADTFELTLALDTAAMFGSDVNGDGVEKVLIIVVAREPACLFEAKNVFEGSALEFGVGH